MSKIVSFLILIINLIILSTNAQVSRNNFIDDYFQKKNYKFCLHRNKLHVEDDFYKWSAYDCYQYSPPLMFKKVIPKNETSGIWKKVPYGIYNATDGTIKHFYFDTTNKEELAVIKNSFKKPRYFEKWQDCVKQSKKCCQEKMTNYNTNSSNFICPAVWDAWYCFDPGKSNENSTGYCPHYMYLTEPPCIQNNYKFCNGTSKSWTLQTDYSTCLYSSLIIDRHEYHIIVLYISIAICIPAIIIFFIYPSLRVTRVILHRNLLIAIVFKNVLVILSKKLITLDALNNGEVLQENGVPCRTLAFFERTSINSMYACMLVDGFYLHKIIVTIFQKETPIVWMYITVAILSLVPNLIWAALKATLDDNNCWIVDEAGYQWVIDGSRYVMLGLNLLLLLNIIRVLIWKLKKTKNSKHTKATLRATLILLPLFGIQFIMMSQRPQNALCLWDSVFYYTSYTIDSLQGILVSMFYCYFNIEVRKLLKKSYNYLKIKFNLNNDFKTENPRRITTSTIVQNVIKRASNANKLTTTNNKI